MLTQKGFSLIEIIIVLIIISVLAAIAIPNYNNYLQQGAASNAQHNLITINNAEKQFYLNNGYYCSTSTQNATCADTLTDLNTGLGLNITDTSFTYACNDPKSGTDGNDGSSFVCTATSTSIAGFSLTLNNAPIVWVGGSGCATTAGASCNPVCAPAASNFCPTN